MNGFTTFADRQEMVMLYKRGVPFWRIARQTGWRYETVRQVIRRYKREGEAALHPQRLGRPPTGALSSFDGKVRYAVLRIKRQHPSWGAAVVQAELANRPWITPDQVPSVSSIERYFRQFGDRLVTPLRHVQPSRAQPREPALAVVHGCWQMDVDERVLLPGVGRVNILNLVDHYSGVKVGSSLFPAQQGHQRRRVSWPQYRQSLRQAFLRWGLPDRIRTDRDQIIVAKDNYPFPMNFTLWLVGLDIEHELIRRVTQNGAVERAHRTWEGRLDGYGPWETLADWQEIVDYERWRMNAILPSRGRHCNRQPPLSVYPQAREPRRWYRLEDELDIFDINRVYDYLAQGLWLRRTSIHGQFSLGGQLFNLGVRHRKRWVQIIFLPGVGFQASCPPDDTPLLIFQLAGLSAAAITGLADDNLGTERP